MDEMRVAMRRRRQLNHTQRRVAAVSFLSNVACGDSKAPRLDCLQNTEVLESYRRSRSKRQTERTGGGVVQSMKPRSAPNSGSRERTPEQRGFKEEKDHSAATRKLSCRQTQQDGQGGAGSRKRMMYQSQWSEDGTLDHTTNNSTPSHPVARWYITATDICEIQFYCTSKIRSKVNFPLISGMILFLERNLHI